MTALSGGGEEIIIPIIQMGTLSSQSQHLLMAKEEGKQEGGYAMVMVPVRGVAE